MGGDMSWDEQKRELGQRIVRIRKRKGWKQTELARRLEVTRERLGRWERGVRTPSLEDLAALSEVLAVPLEELGLGQAGEPLPPTQLQELVHHLKAMARLLRPWMERMK
jgi:transcriptional regulator with XRE-family HTH domain